MIIMNYRDKWFDMCKHCNRSKRHSIRNSAQDYVRNNVERARKKSSDFFDDLFS